MATASTGWSCVASASIVSQTDTTATIRVTAYWRNGSWTYDINWVDAWVYLNGESHQVMDDGSVDAPSHNTSYSLGYHDYVVNKTTSEQKLAYAAKITSSSSYVSGTKWTAEDGYITVPAKKSYTVSYNANGGSGAPGNQTKWHGTNLALSSTKPTRTGYSFSKWNTNSGGTGTSYNPGATYTGNANLALYAIWTANTYTVSYNANGGSGAPGNQTKTYGTTLKLSSTKPTRTNYTFKGWATSASGGVVYAAGANYTANQAVTLYAVWELSYVKPRITNFNAQRCNSAGTVSESGTYAKVTFNWATDKTVTAIVIQYKLATATTWTEKSVSSSGTSGSVSQIVNGSFSAESSYHIRVYVRDGTGTNNLTYSNIATLNTPKYPIDIYKDGTGVAIGKAAEGPNCFDIGVETIARTFIHVIKGSGEAMLKTRRTDSGHILGFGIGDGGQNRGIFEYTKNRWMIYADANGDIYMPGKASSADSASTATKANFFATHAIPENADLNNYTSTGFYNCSATTTAATLKNSPVSVAFGLEITAVNGVHQRLITYQSSSYDVYERNVYAGSWGAWYKVLRSRTLYENSSGSSGTISLADSVGNYNYIEIFYGDMNGGPTRDSLKVHNANGAIVNTSVLSQASNNMIRVNTRKLTISGATITPSNYQINYVPSGSQYNANEQYIFKVVAYR